MGLPTTYQVDVAQFMKTVSASSKRPPLANAPSSIANSIFVPKNKDNLTRVFG